LAPYRPVPVSCGRLLVQIPNKPQTIKYAKGIKNCRAIIAVYCIDLILFRMAYQHLPLEGGHIEPLNHFDKVFTFLETEFKK